MNATLTPAATRRAPTDHAAAATTTTPFAQGIRLRDLGGLLTGRLPGEVPLGRGGIALGAHERRVVFDDWRAVVRSDALFGPWSSAVRMCRTVVVKRASSGR